MSTDNQAPRKFDHGKPQVNLIPTVAIVEMGKVLAFGAQKYDRGNWAKGLATSRYFDAAMRHLWAWNAGEDKDPESGLAHLAHAGVNLCFMIWNMTFRPDLDDRWAPKHAPIQLPEGITFNAENIPHGLWAWFVKGQDRAVSPVFVSADLCKRWDTQDTASRFFDEDQRSLDFSVDPSMEIAPCNGNGTRL